MENLTEKQIKEGLDKAYKEAGTNAYFGNGFNAGVEFALKIINNNVVKSNVTGLSYCTKRTKECFYLRPINNECMFAKKCTYKQ